MNQPGRFSPTSAVPKIIIFSSITFCQASAESDRVLVFTGQNFNSSFLQLVTWDVFIMMGSNGGFWLSFLLICLQLLLNLF